MNIKGYPCRVCAVMEEQKVLELRLEAADKKSILNNMYVGQVENLVPNIKAALSVLATEEKVIFPSARERMQFILPEERAALL